MPTVQIKARLTIEDLLEAVDQLDADGLDSFADELLALRARRLAPHLPQREAELLMKINAPIPAELQQRYDELCVRRRAETLTVEEHEELLELTQHIEAFGARRLEHLAELARLRKADLRSLMDALGVRPLGDG